MIWDIFTHAVALDFAWLLAMALSNLHWLFALFMVSFFFFEGRKPLKTFIHVSIAALIFLELVPFMGWMEFTGSLLLLYYILDFGLLKFAETNKFLAPRLVWVEELAFFGSLILFNVFLL